MGSGENVNNYKLNLDIEPKDNYEKAQKALFEADKAISNLTPAQQQRLANEYIHYKALSALSKNFLR